MINVNALQFDGIELHKWAPGFNSQISGNWAEHRIPGQRGALQEDLGDGVLCTKVALQFVGPTFRQDYNQVMTGLTKNRRGELHHPTRGSKLCVLTDIVETMDWTKQGNAIRVELTFKEAVVHTPDSFNGGPATQAQAVKNHAEDTQNQANGLKKQVYVKFPFNVLRRSAVLLALDAVHGYLRAALTYASSALDAFQEGRLALELVNQLQALPGLVSQAERLLAQNGTVMQIQPIITSMEQCLYAATQLDAAIRANLPPPIVTVVSKSPGQSIYSFVQTWYPHKTRSQQLGLVDILLQLNRGIRRPSLIPFGFRVVRPAP